MDRDAGGGGGGGPARLRAFVAGVATGCGRRELADAQAAEFVLPPACAGAGTLAAGQR